MNLRSSDDFESAIEAALRHEGDGVAETPELAKYGVALSRYPELGENGIRDLTLAEAKAIHCIELWCRLRIGDLPSPVAAKTIDTAIWFAPSKAIEMLQIALNRSGLLVSVDGRISDHTIHACWGADHGAVLRHYRAVILDHARGRIGRDAALLPLLQRWERRAQD